jgi:hypothetical protein
VSNPSGLRARMITDPYQQAQALAGPGLYYWARGVAFRIAATTSASTRSQGRLESMRRWPTPRPATGRDR